MSENQNTTMYELPNIRIVRSLASSINPHLAPMVELVYEGYGFPRDPENEQSVYEFSGEDKFAFIAYDGETPVGSLVVKKLDLEGENNTYEITGIVVHPYHRGKSVSNKLLESFMETFSPNSILATSRNPQLVIGMQKLAERHEMHASFGLVNLTGEENESQFAKRQSIFEKYNANRVIDENGIYYVPTHILPPNPIESIPENLTKAFQPLLEAQERVGESKTAVSTILLQKSLSI